VSIQLSPTERVDAFEVKGRGELQMAVLIETMRREGFEFMVSKPHVITKLVDGKIHEPYEHVFIDVPEEFTGIVTEKLSIRKGLMQNMINHGHGRVDLEFRIPGRGLIGYRSQFLTDTKGPGNIPHRSLGALVADRSGRVTAYACFGMEDRGDLFIPVGIQVYMGMVIGERNKVGDLDLNITREKKLSNMRASGSDNTVVMRPPRLMTLDQAIEYISDDELIEITPVNIRIRKMELDPKNRKVKTRDND
jgi:GTP-binding protein